MQLYSMEVDVMYKKYEIIFAKKFADKKKVYIFALA